MVRIQKYISDCGYTSRRKAEELILKGVVTVDGRPAEIGEKIDENTAFVRVEGKLLRPETKKVYIMLNKPVGYLSSVSDDRGRKTVIDLLKGVKERVVPVGRLDYDTEGLLLLTNDGDFTYTVTHPKHNIEKTYLATLNEIPDEEKLNLLKDGVEIEDYIAKADKLSKGKGKEVYITISQGKNRQVRKMFEYIGYKVVKLKRLSIGKLTLDGLKTGEWKYIGVNELSRIKNTKIC
jgi:23S rRNA pseudouridine2605 synthase